MGSETPAFKNPSGIAGTARLFLGIQVVVGAILIGYSVFLLSFSFSPADSKTHEALIGFFGLGVLVRTVFFIVGGVAFLAWIYRIGRNTHALVPGGVEHSAGMSVGYWFIPFVNLVMPYVCLRDFWKASRSLEPVHDRVRLPGILLVWWLVWTVGNAVGNLVDWIGVSYSAPQGWEALEVMAVAQLLLNLTQLISIALVWRIMTLLNRDQLKRYHWSLAQAHEDRADETDLAASPAG